MPANAATILTVEDDPIVQADLRLMLEDAGYIVCPGARDGVEAVEHARDHRPDLILMDLGLPRLDGVAATAQILAERDVAVVALTGRSNGAALDRASAAGAVGHIVKPFSEGQLIEKLSDVLAERRARLEREWEQGHLMSMIESMSRRGYGERQIVAAVRQATGWTEPATGPGLVDRLKGLLRRVLGP